MKRQIRRNVFETNSSSMHSLTVMKRDEHYSPEEFLDGFYLGDDGIWSPWDDDLEFGRSPFRALGNFHDKWLYACASLVDEYNDDTYKKLEQIALKYVPGLKKIEIPMRSDFVYNKDYPDYSNDEFVQEYGKTEDELNEYFNQKGEKWGVDSIDYYENKGRFYFEEPYTGYVDENILGGFLERENISLEEYLTNKKYVVIQDGDETCYWNAMKKTGLVNMDIVDYEYPKE